MTLQELKDIRYTEINQVTDYLLQQGFIFDSVTFPMEITDQLYYDEISRMGNPAFPILLVGISNNNEVYSLSSNDKTNFCATFLVAKKSIIQAGNDLCQQIWNAIDINAVNAIVDTRI